MITTHEGSKRGAISQPLCSLPRVEISEISAPDTHRIFVAIPLAEDLRLLRRLDLPSNGVFICMEVFESLLDKVMERKPGVSRDILRKSITKQHTKRTLSQDKKPPALPPKA